MPQETAAGVRGPGFAVLDMVSPAGELDQATLTMLLTGAISPGRIAQAPCLGAGAVLNQLQVAAQLAHIEQLSGPMTNFGDKNCHALQTDDLVMAHGSV